jgi:hypothetical protein
MVAGDGGRDVSEMVWDGYLEKPEVCVWCRRERDIGAVKVRDRKTTSL